MPPRLLACSVSFSLFSNVVKNLSVVCEIHCSLGLMVATKKLLGKSRESRTDFVSFGNPFFSQLFKYHRPMPSLLQLLLQLLETLQRALEVFDDVIGERFGGGEIVEVGKGFVLDPEDVETRLVTL